MDEKFNVDADPSLSAANDHERARKTENKCHSRYPYSRENGDRDLIFINEHLLAKSLYLQIIFSRRPIVKNPSL